MLLIPAVDVLDGKVVRLVQGDYQRVTGYGDDPVAAARRWLQEGASLIHLVDLEGARSGEPDPALWERMAAAGVPFQVGGGIRNADTARRALEAGAARVVMGTAAVWNPDELAAVGEPGRVVAALDVRGDRATGAGWLDQGRELGTVLENLAAVGVGRVLVTGIGRDGTLQGPDLGLVRRVRQHAPHLAVIASGGVGSVADLLQVKAAGCEAVIVGRALYDGLFTLAEARQALG